jgi:hypothetical protein
MSPPAIKIALRVAGVLSFICGIAGVCVWVDDIDDLESNGSLRFGRFRNPLVQYPSFNMEFQEYSMHALLWSSVAMVIGGILCMIPLNIGRHFVTLAARVAIVINVTTSLFVLHQIAIWHWHPTRLELTAQAVLLRVGVIAIDVVLWVFLNSSLVRHYFQWRLHPPSNAFPVILKESNASAG